MSFDVTADAYGRFMGRFSEPLAARFLELLDLPPGSRVLDVGSGPGAVTRLLVDELGTATVAAIDSSAPFVAALHDRLPGVDVREGSAEELPWTSDSFDVTVAQLVIHLVGDPVRTLSEMVRVTRTGGLVAANVWDHAGGNGPLETFWRAVRELDPGARDESGLAGARAGHLAELCAGAGLRRIESGLLTVSVPYTSFEEWWQPFTLGVGPAGSYYRRLDDDGRAALRTRCSELQPTAPFEVTGCAWWASGRV